MSNPARPGRPGQPTRGGEPHRVIFISLAVILAALVLYFALGAIPSALRPSLSPTTTAPTAPVSSASSQP
jgi:hypothetical protein